MTQKPPVLREGVKLSNNKITIGSIIDGKDYDPNDKALSRAAAEAKKIIEDSQARAQKMKLALEKELGSIQEKAYQDGFQEGLKTGHQEAFDKTNAELKSVLVDGHNILQSIEKERTECLQEEDTRLMSFFTTLVKKVILRDLSFEPEKILALIKQAISSLDHKAEVNIIINDKTANKLNEIKESLKSELPGIQSLTVTGDNKLEAGDFIVESNQERLDIRLESQIDNLLDQLISEK